MNRKEEINCEIVRLARQITDACAEDLSKFADRGEYIDRLVGRVQKLRTDLREIEAASAPMPKGFRPYTLMEAFETFGWRSYTDVCRIKAIENHFNADDEYVPRLNYQIDGMIISSGHVQVRIHPHMGSDDYTYVSLDDLLREWCWPGGARCGVKVEEYVHVERCPCCNASPPCENDCR